LDGHDLLYTDQDLEPGVTIPTRSDFVACPLGADCIEYSEHPGYKMSWIQMCLYVPDDPTLAQLFSSVSVQLTHGQARPCMKVASFSMTDENNTQGTAMRKEFRRTKQLKDYLFERFRVTFKAGL